MLTACGARLSDEERTAAIAALAGGGQGAGGTTDGTTDGADTGGGTTGGTTGGGTTSGGTTGGGTAGGTTGGGGGGAAAVAGGKGCPAGALKASDTGVTEEQITVATIADIEGVQPGLFQSAWDAANAASAYINSQGGICGRQLKPQLLDGRTDSVANRAAMAEACDNALAVVGSVSAFDDGSAKPGQDCKIPDMTAITTNPQKFSATNVFPIFPNGDKVIGLTSAKYIKSKYPDVISKAGILWLNQSVTRGNAQRRVAGWESLGYKFVYQQEVQVLEADYTRFVLDMRSQGVQYVTMVSDFQNIDT
jgi:ABC-type branched-subunit amino acid transport system substrate-binding protein